MLTTRWQPIVDVAAQMHRFQQEMEQLFGPGFMNGRPAFSPTVYPPLNLWEDDDNLYVEAELPGLELSELEILVSHSNQLSIQGERRPPVVENATWQRQERGFGKFHRVLALPQHVEADKVAAEFKQGVLTITLPKLAEAKPRRIAVKAC